MHEVRSARWRHWNVFISQYDNLALKINELVELFLMLQAHFITGHVVRLSTQQDEFLALVTKLNIPVVITLNRVDVIAEDNPCYIGRIGTLGQRAGDFALQNADSRSFYST